MPFTEHLSIVLVVSFIKHRLFIKILLKHIKLVHRRTVSLKIIIYFALIKRLLTNKLVIMNQSTISTAAIEEWISEDLTPQAVESRLISQGYDLNSVQEHLIEFKRLKRTKNHPLGLMILTFCVQVGIIACFVAMHKS